MRRPTTAAGLVNWTRRQLESGDLKMRNRFVSLRLGAATFAIAALCLGVDGCGGSDRTSGSASAEAAPRAAVVQVRRAPQSNTLSITGEFLPFQEVELHAKVAGYIRNINVDIGDRVHTGQVLAVLEIPELTAQLQAAAAGGRHSQ